MSAKESLTLPLPSSVQAHRVTLGEQGPQDGEAGMVELHSWQIVSGALVLAAVFGWSYWPVLRELVATWLREPDYSHGFLVVPVACLMLWARRHSLPAVSGRVAWWGLILLCLGLAVRVAGSLWYVDAVQAWSIPVWIAGIVWLLGGWKLLRWSLPAVLFLAFMIPLPFRVERMLSSPLQAAASRMSCWMLQTVGQPAVREGNIVVVDDLQIEVVEACSGLRIFVSIVALAFAYTVLVQRPLWTKTCLWLSVLPIALLANSARIATTGLLYLHVSGEAAHRFSHDAAGWLMIPLAAVMMAGVIGYMDRLIVKVQFSPPSEAMLPGIAGRPA